MPVRPKATSPEPGIPLLPTSSQTRYPQDQYGELESSAGAEAPSTRRRGEAKTNGLTAVLGGGKPSEIVQRLVVKPGWFFLLVAFALGAGAAWILQSLSSPTSPTSLPPPPSPTYSTPGSTASPATYEDTLLNPWTRPGTVVNRPMLSAEEASHMGESREANPWKIFNKVRWAPDPSDDIHSDYGQGGESLMEQLADAAEREELPADWGWAFNKTILGIGDSLMRNNVDFFSKHISNLGIGRNMLPLKGPDGVLWQEGHYMGVINVPRLNMKVANWFSMGMVEGEGVPNFWEGQNRPHRFEDKLQEVLLATVDHPDGLDGRHPDLIVFESLSWDLVFLARLAYAAGDRRYQGRPLDQIELDWAKGRQIQVLRLLRDTFPTTKIIVQTPHLGTKSPEHVFSPVRKLQQSELVRSISFDTGFELFDWGRIVSPLSNELRDGLHFVAGSATWLWGEMVLSYLRRAHFHPVNIPPPPTPNAHRITQQDLVDSYTQPKIQYLHTGINDD